MTRSQREQYVVAIIAQGFIKEARRVSGLPPRADVQITQATAIVDRLTSVFEPVPSKFGQDINRRIERAQAALDRDHPDQRVNLFDYAVAVEYMVYRVAMDIPGSVGIRADWQALDDALTNFFLLVSDGEVTDESEEAGLDLGIALKTAVAA